ncbi:hypothetical protein [Alysiella filiformis]|uniref:hypothetical protein n=1 Tax=Alysiella filiformis TaxID=194196 RepID=UPI0015CBD502|nr:hypothetical protein H3L97_06465 [Alysiella filiformis]
MGVGECEEIGFRQPEKVLGLSGSLNGEKSHDARLMNDNVAHWTKRFPQQYLFAYNRYKHPWGAPNRPE